MRLRGGSLFTCPAFWFHLSKYYNYEIYQDYLKAQKHDRQTPQNNDRSSPTINHFPNAQKVQIFENVDRYYETPPKDPPS
ncbi:MAG: hypothetical protein J0L70_07475 [Leptolyngbya sp. UWPOB_LEPTO1]|uniref:hypothetical protein n=1 Tax=Leptolyngbya sp. UWPOB_LEPTO1 TaxID=2815653 RepID=UPI001AD58F25|nr:hypothetical protein [Leptolyngbya sp. UWPOB_LEPTO1]MBN8560343.1 hypothetical protein [Leptolyngbya sp. UWPOB_LEPTO1]